MGPGPWTIRKDLQLPKSDTVLHITNKNRRSNLSVSHMLKIIFRVERGDDVAVDPQSGKRKLFDIVVQTPVHILSVRILFRSLSSRLIRPPQPLCNPDYISLPPYTRLPDLSSSSLSTSAHTTLTVLTGPDGEALVQPLSTIDTSSVGPSTSQRRSVSVHGLAPHASSTTSSLSGRRPSPGHLTNTLTSDQSVDSLQPVSPTGSIGVASPPLSRRPSFHERNTPELFERLIAGQETEDGEAPPSYEAAVESAASSPLPSAVGH